MKEKSAASPKVGFGAESEPRRPEAARGRGSARAHERRDAAVGVGERWITRPSVGRRNLTFGPLDEIVGLHISLANSAILQNFKRRLQDLQLTQKQTSLLWLVDENPGVSQVDFARLFRIDRATMLGITNSLTKRALIERRPMRGHRRRLGLHLTTEGEALLAQAKAAVTAHERWVKKRYSAAEIAAIKSLMKRLYE